MAVSAANEEDGEHAYFADPADVLRARLFVEAKILVESEADVVAVEAVGELLEVEEMLLERACDRRLRMDMSARIPSRGHVAHAHLAASTQAGEPDGDALLREQLCALGDIDGSLQGVSATFLVSRCEMVLTGVEGDVGGDLGRHGDVMGCYAEDVWGKRKRRVGGWWDSPSW